MENTRNPNLFIVGAPKCGTTSMYDYLKHHQEIFMSERKELHFFGTDLYAPHFVRDAEKYLSYFKNAGDKKRIGEGSTWYLYSKLAANEIKNYYPNAKIIIMLRNPVDMMYSLHNQRLYNGNEDIADFEAALEAEEDRKKGVRLPKNPYLIEGLYYREVAKFAQQVRRYIDAFGKENVRIIIFDDFKVNTAKVFKETLRFLDVTTDFDYQLRTSNPNKRARSQFMRNILNNPPQTALQFVKKIIPQPIRHALREKVVRLNTISESRPPMNPKLRSRLQTEFKPEIEELSKLLGRDLTDWCKNE